MRVLFPARRVTWGLAVCLAACSGADKKPAGGPPPRPECECAQKMTEEGDACSCPHCMSRDSGMERVPCRCPEREGK